MVNLMHIRAFTKAEQYLEQTPGKRKLLKRERAIAEDVEQLLDYERGYAAGPLGGSPDRLPSAAILLACWGRARDSWERVMKALPPGTALREAMRVELAERDESMRGLQAQAEAMLKGVEDA
jgi:hypothetical protein